MKNAQDVEADGGLRMENDRLGARRALIGPLRDLCAKGRKSWQNTHS